MKFIMWNLSPTLKQMGNSMNTWALFSYTVLKHTEFWMPLKASTVGTAAFRNITNVSSELTNNLYQ